MNPTDYLWATIDREEPVHALRDSNTCLPNALLFLDRLTHALVRGTRSNAVLGVLVVDVAPAGELGIPVDGEQIMRTLAECITDTLRSSDTVARVGSDGFAVVLEDATNALSAEMVTVRILDALRPPFATQGREFRVVAKIGLASSIPPHPRPEVLLREAATALHRAQAKEGSGYAVFDAYHDAHVLEQLSAPPRLTAGRAAPAA